MRYVIVALLALASVPAFAQDRKPPSAPEIALDSAFTALQANISIYAAEMRSKVDQANKHAADVDAWWRSYVGEKK